MSTRRELVQAVADRYRAASRPDKKRILDEFVAITGYHRKHAIRALGQPFTEAPSRRPRLKLYDEAVRDALIVLWEASDRICGKRLKALVPILVDSLERHGHLRLDEHVRSRVLAVSAATIDRLLTPTRETALGQRRRRASAPPLIRKSVPVRTFADWWDPPPGFMEADLVAHSGVSMAGSFVHTLTLTDICSGWTECVALPVRESMLVVEAVTRLRTELPFELLGLDVDNGSEFLNDTVLDYCRRAEIEFTRSRPYRKNDQAWVEQKNGAVVRRLVGYHRLEGMAAAEALTRLYAVSRLFVNFFQPSFKLASKTRVGARVSKKYHPAATPCARLLDSERVPEATKAKLRDVLATLDPLRLLDEIRALQDHVVKVAGGQVTHLVPSSDAGLERFLTSLSSAWKEGEIRPTHRPDPKPRRHWRTRKDDFAPVWPQVRGWLEAEPDRTAREILERLQWAHPNRFADGQRRTLQRRIREWRRETARRLVFPAGGEPMERLCVGPLHSDGVAGRPSGQVAAHGTGSITP